MSGSSRWRIILWSSSRSIQPLMLRLMSLKSQTMCRSSSDSVRTSTSATALWPCGCLQTPS